MWDVELDCTGLLCPLPVLKAQKRLRGMASGQVLALLASDAMAAVDVPLFCRETGHQFLGSTPEAEAIRYLIRRHGGRAEPRGAGHPAPPDHV